MDLFDHIPTTEPASPPAGQGLFDHIPAAPAAPQAASMSLSDRLKDAGKAAGAGYLRGVAGLIGAPADIANAVATGADFAQSKITGRPREQIAAEANARAVLPQSSLAKVGGAALAGYLEDAGQAVTGEDRTLYKPQTTAGHYAERVGEFLPGAALGGGNAARNAAVYAAAPAVASEAAGQATAGSKLEPYARIAAGLAAGGTTAFLTRPNVAEAAIARAAGGLSPEVLDASEQLMRDAAKIGVPLTRAEAVQAVTNGGTKLGDLQRVVEGGGGMKDFFAQRPGQIDAAARQTFDAVAPQLDSPSTIGPAVGQVAQGEVATTQKAINDATRPLYQAAEGQRVGPQVHVSLVDDPLYAQTLKEIRDNPALNRTVAGLPDDAVGTIDLVRRRLREQADAAAAPGQASTSNTAASNFRDAAIAPTTAAEAVTGGASGPYVQAREAQTYLRDKYLAPLQAGPIGQLAKNDLTTRQAIDVLFPANPLPGSAGEIMDTVGRLSAAKPEVARRLVRAHLEGTFNEASQALQGGANQFAGAGYAAVLKGNTQQAENLAAAIRALPDGEHILPGFDKFLDIMSATGQRQRIGSQTAFNTEVQGELKRGGTLGNLATMTLGGGVKLPAAVYERFQQWNLGRNTDQIARILTDPEAGNLFRHLAAAPSSSAKATALASRLSAIGVRASSRRNQP